MIRASFRMEKTQPVIRMSRAFSENRELFALKTLVCLSQTANENVDRFILLFGNHQKPHGAVVREILLELVPVLADSARLC